MNQETLNLLATAVVVPVLVALVPYLVALIKSGTEYIRQRNKDKDLEKYIGIAEDAVQTAVISTFQTFVSKIKDTNGWTRETQDLAFREAKAKAIAIMGTATREALREVYDDFDAWLDNKIEFYVTDTP